MKKYVVHGGYVMSKNDEQLHYIGAVRLAKLYKLKISECILVNREKDLKRMITTNMIHVYPSYNGNYDLKKSTLSIKSTLSF